MNTTNHTSPSGEDAANGAMGERAYGVYRTREDENDGKEFFYHAMWHNDYLPQEGERVVPGVFVPDRAALPAEKVAAEPVAWAVYWGIGEMRENSVHFEKETAVKVAAQIKSNTEIRPLYAAPPAQTQVALTIGHVDQIMTLVMEYGDYRYAHCLGGRKYDADKAVETRKKIKDILLLAAQPAIGGKS